MYVINRKEVNKMTVKEKAIYFDMDGTIANLYGVENWLEYLETFRTTPYAKAKPLLDMRTLARYLNELHSYGYTIGIVSWLSKTGTKEYNERVAVTKKVWLKYRLKSVVFDEIHIVEYGTPKQTVVEKPNGLLFDDELKKRNDWTGTALDVDDILGTLHRILKEERVGRR
jgi:hypothetical protein